MNVFPPTTTTSQVVQVSASIFHHCKLQCHYHIEILKEKETIITCLFRMKISLLQNISPTFKDIQICLLMFGLIYISEAHLGVIND